MYAGTIDEHWVMQALGDLDPGKIMFADPIQFQYVFYHQTQDGEWQA